MVIVICACNSLYTCLRKARCRCYKSEDFLKAAFSLTVSYTSEAFVGVPSDCEVNMAEASPSTSSESSKAVSCANRISKAEEFKQSGNVLFKEKNYKKAIGKYHRGLLQIRDVERKGGDLLQSFMGFTNQGGSVTKSRDSQLTEEMAKQIKQLELSFYNNLAACLLHDDKPNYKRIMEYCDEVLSRDSENPKAWYRKGVALYHIQEYEEALTCLNKAKESMPRDGEIRRYLQLCEEGNAKQLQAEKLRYQGLFKKMADSDVDG